MSTEVHYNDLKVSDYEIGLTKLTGKQIKEVKGYLSMEFGETTFKITKVVLADDTEIQVEGEHDFPYLACYEPTPPNMDDETLERLYYEENPEKEDEDE